MGVFWVPQKEAMSSTGGTQNAKTEINKLNSSHDRNIDANGIKQMSVASSRLAGAVGNMRILMAVE